MYLKVFIISILIALIGIYFNSSILNKLQILIPKNVTNSQSKSNLFTNDELKLYNGIDKPQLYLAIMGIVFDVTKGSAHYGQGKSYNFFVGRDTSRSFITGKFNEDEASDDVVNLTPEELRSLHQWVQFYKKEYTRVGKLIGRYYQEDGKLTPYGKEVKKLIKAADKAQEEKNMNKLKYPPCNVEWDAERGTRVWCTNRSGGIQRDWIGVPRQLYVPGSQDYRCACIQSEQQNVANLKEYEGCDSEADSCYIKT